MTHAHLTGTVCTEERYYFLESEKNGLKFWLRARTVGLCATCPAVITQRVCTPNNGFGWNAGSTRLTPIAGYNRLLKFRVVRSTQPVVYIPPVFLYDTDFASKRTEAHLAKHPAYPDPMFYLHPLAKYYLRSPVLAHLRIEQVLRRVTLCVHVSGSGGGFFP